MEIARGPADTFYHYGQNDESVHREREQEGNRNQVAIAAESTRRRALAVDDREEEHQDGDTRQVRGSIIRDARDHYREASDQAPPVA
jgi:hypothetical protein